MVAGYGLDVRPGDRQVGGSLFKVSRGEGGGGVHERQLRSLTGARREGLQQRLQGLRVAVEHEAEAMVGQHPRRLGPSARRLGVPYGVDDLAVLAEPGGGLPVQLRYFRGERPAQFES